MTAPDDLAGLFAPTPESPSQDMRFRQGTVTAWNPLTAQNTVRVGGTLFTDLPILNTSEALLLQPDDVVAIAVIGSDASGARTYAIMGRLTIPNTPSAGSSLESLRTDSATVSTLESTASGAYTDLTTVGPSVSVLVGPSGRCLVTVSAGISVDTAKGFAISTGEGRMSYDVAGATVRAAADDWALRFKLRYDTTGDNFAIDGALAASRTTLQDGLTPGTHTFTAKYRAVSRTPSFEDRNITAVAI